jgi:hypothetical protein
LDVTRADPNSDLTISVAPKSAGWTDLYLSANGTLPGPTSAGWSSLHTSATSGRSIVVKPTDPGFCGFANCTWSLAVRGLSSSALPYTVTYYYGDSIVTLMPGTPFSAAVSAGETMYFRTLISSLEQDISISSTQYIGDVNLYANQADEKPNATNAVWRASSNSTTGAHIAIRSTDQEVTYGPMLIAVYGLTDARFALAVTNDNVMLTAGMPTSASCGYYSGAVQYYFLNFQQANVSSSAEYADILFDIAAIRSRVGQVTVSEFDLWISTNPNITKPDATSAMWHPHLNDGQQFRIRPNETGYCLSNCTFYIAVSCASTIRGQYEITASTSDTREVLAVTSVPERGQVSVGLGKYYEVYLSTASNFSLWLEPCYGQVVMYQSQSYNRPDGADATHYDLPTFTSTNSVYKYDYKPPTGASPVTKVFFGVYQVTAQPGDMPAHFQVTASYLGQRVQNSPKITNPKLAVVGLAKNSVQFQFLPAVSELGTEPKDLIYTLYWTQDDSNVVLYTECGAKEVQRLTGHVMNLTLPTEWSAHSTIEATLPGLQENMLYRFNILVTDPRSVSGPSAYEPQVARPNGSGDGGVPSGSTSNKVILGIAIPIAIIVAVLLGYLWYKNRKMSKELSIEMHDVPAAALRKAARGAADPEVSKTERAKNFHKLLQEDEVDSSDMYVAPSGSIQRTSAVDEL